MKQLTEELFRYSVILSSDSSAETEELCVNQVLEDCIMGYYAALTEKGINPVIELTEEKVTRTVDRSALARVFNNLMNNALKYSDGDLKVTMTEPCIIEFTNSAPDISQTQVERLFDRFYRADSSRSRETGGTGIGLSAAQAIVLAHKGTIRAAYEGDRIVFTVSLP